jgi:hypothetical protein
VSAKEDSKGNTKLGKKDVMQLCIGKGPPVIMLVSNSRVTHPQTFPLYMQLGVTFSAPRKKVFSANFQNIIIVSWLR